MSRRIEVPYTTDPIHHGLGTPNPVVTVFWEGCSQLFDWEPLSPDEISVRAGFRSGENQEWMDLPADKVVVEHG
jgi:hypothetical protein